MSHPHPMPGAAIHLGRTKRSPFRICAYVGLASGFVVSLALAARVQISPVTTTLVAVSGVLTVLVSIGLTRIIAGPQQLVFYRHFIIVIIVASTFVWLTGQPVLPYLDVTVVGISALVACGRIGCLMVGCCHGRPSSFGICYREWQVTAAFPSRFLGVRLFPIQALESLWAACIVVGGCTLLWNQHVPGAGVGWFIATYCPARFVFEFFRWRPDPFYSGLSEAQWISLGLLSLIVALESLHVLPYRWWHVATVVLLGVLTLSVVLTSSWRRIVHPQLGPHTCETDIAKVPGTFDRARNSS